MFPQARTSQLTIRELADETLVYDRDRHKAHCLNTTAALIWRRCDGKTSVDELTRWLAEELGIASAAEVVSLALEQLTRRHLLEPTLQPLGSPAPVSRREALKQLVRAAITLPIIMTIATRAAAQSLSSTSSSDPPASSPPVSVSIPVNVSIGGSSNTNSGSSRTTSTPPVAHPPPTPCRTRGQSCLAAASGQVGTCCAGLSCNGVSQGAGVCG